MRKRLSHVFFGAATALTALGASVLAMGQQEPVPGSGRVSGWTLTPAGEPLAGVEVALACPPLPVQRVMSDHWGRFEFRSAAGNCRVIARKEGRVSASFDGEPAPGGYRIAVRGGSTHDAIELRLAPAGTITGVISAPDRELPEGLRFQVVRREVTAGIERLVALSYALVRRDGRFTASGLAPGDYYLVASPAPFGSPGTRDGFAVTYFPGTPRRSDATVIAVKAGDLREANFQLAAAGTFSVSGVVSDVAGSPLTDVTVGVTFAEPPNWIRGTARTGTDGRFVIGGLQDGSYVLRASRTNAAGRQEMEAIYFDVNGADVPYLIVRMGVR
jgi:hypothetical protein